MIETGQFFVICWSGCKKIYGLRPYKMRNTCQNCWMMFWEDTLPITLHTKKGTQKCKKWQRWKNKNLTISPPPVQMRLQSFCGGGYAKERKKEIPFSWNWRNNAHTYAVPTSRGRFSVRFFLSVFSIRWALCNMTIRNGYIMWNILAFTVQFY